MPKNAQTAAQAHSSHTLAKYCSKFSMPGFNGTWTMNFQMFKLDLEKAEKLKIKLPTSIGSLKKQESSRKKSTFLVTLPKPLTVFSSVTQPCLTLYDSMDWSTPGLPVHHQLLEFTQTHVHWVGDAIQPSHPLSSPSPPPSIFPSIRVFSNESFLCIRWPKDCSFSFTINLSKGYLGLISFRMDWLDLLAVQGTLKSLLQHHNSKASILWLSAFFIVQLSHSYTTTRKTIALTRQTFVGKVMSLLFDMISRLVITFLPRSKHLLISWLQSPSAVILEPQRIKPLFPLFPHLFAMKWWDQMPWS